MAKSDSRIDEYIDKAAPFAKPILDHIRALVHTACPEVEETMKWSFPHFDYKGEMMCSMAGFKQHCAFGFWKGALLKSVENVLQIKDREAMGHLGRITSLKDLPNDRVMIKMIKEACALNEQGIKIKKAVTAKPINKQIHVPADVLKALSKNHAAKKIFEAASYSFKKEYIQWIEEAKSESTRNTRIATAVEWIAEGKGRNWKYERPKK